MCTSVDIPMDAQATLWFVGGKLALLWVNCRRTYRSPCIHLHMQGTCPAQLSSWETSWNANLQQLNLRNIALLIALCKWCPGTWHRWTALHLIVISCLSIMELMLPFRSSCRQAWIPHAVITGSVGVPAIFAGLGNLCTTSSDHPLLAWRLHSRNQI